MTPAEILGLIDQLRDRGATIVEVEGVRVVFGPKPIPEDEKPLPKPTRSVEDRLLRPLGIKKPLDAKAG